jgi:hypothetical protein
VASSIWGLVYKDTATPATSPYFGKEKGRDLRGLIGTFLTLLVSPVTSAAQWFAV